jgi:dTDP-6-deoxy-L-talose 4-dehydrogenase (NAD+)
MSDMILLTGATGFVGRQIHRALAERGRKIRLVVRSQTSQRLGAWKNEHIEIIDTPDLFAESPEWWQQVCAGVDTVIHSAWYVEPGKYQQSSRNIDCLIGTLSLAKGVVAAGVRRFVGIGTCFEYDLSAGALSVETPLRPRSPYAAAKAAAYMTLEPWLSEVGLEFVWCRLFYLYGEGEAEGRLVPYLRARLSAGERAELTSGTQVRDYMDVRDAGQMIAETALGTRQGAINVCSGVPITVRQLAEDIADEYGRRDLLHFGVRPDNPVDPPYVVGIKDEVPS